MSVRYIVVVDYTKLLTSIDDCIEFKCELLTIFDFLDFDNNNEHVFYVFTSRLRYVCCAKMCVIDNIAGACKPIADN